MVAGIPSISFIYHIRAFKKLTFVTTVTLPTSFSFFPGNIEHFTRQMPSTPPLAINLHEEMTVYVVFSLTSSSAYSNLFSHVFSSLASPSIADTVLHSAEIKQMQKCSLESGCCLVVDSNRDL